MVMTSTSACVQVNLVTFIIKNLLSEDAIVTFVTDTELHFKWYIFRVKVPFKPYHFAYLLHTVGMACTVLLLKCLQTVSMDS